MTMGIRSLLSLLCILAIAGSLTAQPNVPTHTQEHEILQAVAIDPYLFTLHKDLAVTLLMGPTSTFPYAHPWFSPTSAPDEREIIGDDGRVITIARELIEAARQQNNRKSISLRFLSIPATQPTTRKTQRRIVSLSRPGFSVDGTQALVAVTLTWQANGYSFGYTVHLHRNEGVWLIDGHGAEWIE